jgi:hypothetical protein
VSALDQQSAQLQLRVAMEARDLSAVVDSFAPDAVFRSPITDRLAFHGHGQIAAISEVILDLFQDLRYTQELRTDGDGFLVGQARIGNQQIEWVDHLRLRPDGKISELTVFFRPLPATAVALRLIGAGLSRRKSPIRAEVVSALARPLELMARIGDRIGVRLLGPTL